MRPKTILLLAALTAMMAFSATAFAQDNPAANVYGGDAGEVKAETESSPDVVPSGNVVSETPTTPVAATKTVPTAATGSLPFTGFEAGLVALLGAALLGTGFMLRRSTRRDSI